MKAMKRTFLTQVVTCLILWLVAPSALASLSEEETDFGFETAPETGFELTAYEDTVAHSNQGGKKNKKHTMFEFIIFRRALVSPTPEIAAASQGLLIEFEGPVMPSGRSAKFAPVPETTEDTGGGDTWTSKGSSVVPAPGALLLLGLAAVGRRRRRRI